MSRVSSMELEGISNACRINVMMNRPVTSTLAREARNSTVVSRGFSLASTTTSRSFFGTLATSFKGFFLGASLSAHQPEGAFPARYLEHMSHRVGKVIKSITHG